MGAAKKLEMFPDEAYLAEALRDGRAIRTEISMKELGKPDTRLQAREQHLDLGHVHMLHEILRREEQLAPVVVFKDGAGNLMLADGFHRHEVYRREKLGGIPAYQINGEFRDAIEYATMCNRRLCLARKQGDIRKAIEILLADEVWFNRADTWIGDHIGCETGTVAKWRARFCEERGIPLPPRLLKRNGSVCRYGDRPAPRIRTSTNGKGQLTYKVVHGNKVVASTTNKESAESAYLDATKRHPEARRSLAPMKPNIWTRKARPGHGSSVSYEADIGGKHIYLGIDRAKAQAKLDQLWAEYLKTLEQPATNPDAMTVCLPQHYGKTRIVDDPARTLADRILALTATDRKLIGDVIGEDILGPFLEGFKG